MTRRLRITLTAKNETGAAMIRALTGNDQREKENSDMVPVTQQTTNGIQEPDAGVFHRVCETLRETLLKLSPQERVEAMVATVNMMSGWSPARGDAEALVALVLHPDADFGVEQIQQLYGRGADKNINPTKVITQELLRRGILTEEQLTRTQLAAELAKRGVCEELSTETLINKVLHLCAKEGHDSLPFFGCVVCGDSRHLSTHVVPGYGNVCSDHAPYQQRAVAETWAVEGRELHKRGIRRQPAEG